MHGLRTCSTLRCFKVRPFFLSQWLTCREKTDLTTTELEYLRTLPRTRDVLVQDFMVTPSWFSQNMEKDVKEIARFVTKTRDPEAKKRNWRLYKFATTRSPKEDAKPSRVVHIGTV